MPEDPNLLEPLLDSWKRGNDILINLLHAIPESGLAVRPMPDSPSVAEMFHHIHYVRLALLAEDAPEVASKVPAVEWDGRYTRDELAHRLQASAAAVSAAVRDRVVSGIPMLLHYDHPILLMQHMLWHEGYHHGQIKLALKLAGEPLTNGIAGPLTWRVWMNKAMPRN